MIWHTTVIGILRASGIFLDVRLSGGKVRASIDAIRFLDIHFDPESRSYSYAFIDLSLPYPGDKRLFGWDDFPHPGDLDLRKLSSFPHHFQRRTGEGRWIFEASEFHGDLAREIPVVVNIIQGYLTGKANA